MIYELKYNETKYYIILYILYEIISYNLIKLLYRYNILYRLIDNF